MSLEYEILEDVEIDEENWVLWHSCPPKRIMNFLGRKPQEHQLVRWLRLQNTFSIEYSKPSQNSVIEVAKNFDSKANTFEFRGKVYPFNKDVLREAFQLPTGEFSEYRKAWKGEELPLLIRGKTQNARNPFSITRLTEAAKEWEGPIRLVMELLLGRRKPTLVSGKHLWYFYSHLWHTIVHLFPGEDYERPSLSPDWAEIMHDDLTMELNNLGKHLQRKSFEDSTRKPEKLPCYCATAVTHLLKHFGFSLEQLNGEGSIEGSDNIHAPIIPNSATVRDDRGSSNSLNVEQLDIEGPTEGSDNIHSPLIPSRSNLDGSLGPSNSFDVEQFSTDDAAEGGEDDEGFDGGGDHFRNNAFNVEQSDAEGATEEGEDRERCVVDVLANLKQTADSIDEGVQIQLLDSQQTSCERGVHSLHSLRTELPGQVATLRADRISPDGEIQSPERTSETLQSRHTELADKVTSLQSRETELTNKHATLQSHHTDLTNQVAELDAERIRRESQVTALRGEVDTLQTFCTQLTATLASLDADKQSGCAEIQSLQKGLQTLQSRRTELNTEVEALEAKKRSTESEVAKLQKERDTLQSCQTELTSKHATLQSHHTDLTKQVAELDVERIRRESQVAALRGEVDTLQTLCTQLTATLASLDADKQSGCAEIQSLEKRLQSRRTELTTEVEALEAKKGSTESEVAKLRREIDTLRSSQTELTNKHETLQSHHTDLTKQVAELDAEIIRRESQVAADKQSAYAEIQPLEKGLQTLQSHHTELVHEVAGLQSRRTELNTEVDALEVAKDSLGSEVAALQKKLRTLQPRCTELADQVTALVARRNLCESELGSRKKAVHELQAQQTEHTSQVASLQTSITELTGKEASLKSGHTELLRQVTRLHVHHTALTMKVARLEAEKDSLETQLDALQKEVHYLLQQRSTELTDRVTTPQNEMQTPQVDQVEESGTRKSLRKAGDGDSEEPQRKRRLQKLSTIEELAKKKSDEQNRSRVGEASVQTPLRAPIDGVQAESQNQQVQTHQVQKEKAKERDRAIETHSRAGPSLQKHSSANSGGVQIELPEQVLAGTPNKRKIQIKDVIPRLSVDDSELTETLEPPPGHLVELVQHPHQKKGLAWLVGRENAGNPSGGLLADDQGMGKTIQIISLILTKRGRTLVVVPTSVLPQWAREIAKKTTPAAGLKVYEFHGAKRIQDPKTLAEFDVVLTTYGLLPREVGEGGVLGAVEWYRVVLDECHKIKGHAGAGSIAASRLRARHRWCVSGTPFQNTSVDAFAYFRFLKYRDLCDWDNFKELHGRIMNGDEGAVQELHDHVRSFTLRRMKDSLTQDRVPPKTCNQVYLSFTNPKDQAVYDRFEEDSKEMFKRVERGNVNANTIFSLLTRMKQLCLHRSLMWAKNADEEPAPKNWARESLIDIVVDRKLEDPCSTDGCRNTLSECAISTCQHMFCSACEQLYNEEPADCPVPKCGKKLTNLYSLDVLLGEEKKDPAVVRLQEEFFEACVDPDESSPKLEAVLEYIKNLPIDQSKSKSGAPIKEKALVFSQWTSALDLLEKQLVKNNIAFARLDGTMTLTRRTEALNEFRDDDQVSVILLSLMAANTGLNITEANHVLFMDLWWNPTMEDQAIDRAHRLGQVKEVKVTHFIMKNTIEEAIWSLQDKKRQIIQSILYGTAPATTPATRKADRLNDLRHIIGKRRP